MPRLPRQPKRSKSHGFTEAQIRARAYALWQQRGEDSTDQENWEDAIKELQREQRVSAKAQQLWESRLRKLRDSDKRTAAEDWQDAQARLQESWWAAFIRWTGIQEKQGWDVAQLLVGISIPIVLFVGGQYFTSQNNDKQQKLADERARQDRQLADDKAKQDTLVKYLDQMAESMTDDLLTAKPGDKRFIVAQARTVIALQSLDRKRQHLVIQFLGASGLNDRPNNDWQPRDKQGQPNPLPAETRVLLYGAQLSKANLVNSDLSGVVLVDANLEHANLGCNPPESKAADQCSDLSGADLSGANLDGADLSGADLLVAHFDGADLSLAHFDGADLQYADLSGANLSGANLSGAHLYSANLSQVILLATDLRDTENLTPQQLEGNAPPYLCHVALPQGFTVNPNRDCDRIAQVLFEHFPNGFDTLEDAQDTVNNWRQYKWSDEPPPN